jgi:hypothetical protein
MRGAVASSNRRAEERLMKRLGWRRWLILIAFLLAAAVVLGMMLFRCLREPGA